MNLPLSGTLTRPAEVIRSLSVPPVSTVTVSSAGNLIAVLVSPVWTILSAIVILLKVGSSVNVTVAPTPDAVAVKFPLTKLIFPTLPAEPTTEPSSLTVNPPKAPTWLAVSPVRLAPEPENDVAVTTPVTLIPPVPVMNLLLKSKFPPSCGVVSSTTFLRNVLANLPSAIDPAS